MKTRLLLLTMIILTALGLGATLAFRKSSRPDGPPTALAPAPVAPAVQTATATREVSRYLTNTVELDWTRVESEDYRKYIANLRAIGCPETTIRDIIVADVNKVFEARENALTARTEPFQDWKNQRSRPPLDSRFKERMELAREKRAVLKELLGVDVPDATPLTLNTLRQGERLGFLPKDKQAAILELETTFEAKVNALMAGKARPTREDLEAFKQLEADSQADLAKALSPQEFQDYELRNSSTAEYLRRTQGDFAMTQQEFCDLFKLRKQFDTEFRFTSSENPRRVAAQLELEQQTRALLGEERYTEFNREQNWSTSSLRNVAQEFGIDKEVASRVFDLKPLTQEEATRIRLNPNLTDEQRQHSLQAIQQETLKAIGDIIGPEAAQAYYRDGAWIRSLTKTQ